MWFERSMYHGNQKVLCFICLSQVFLSGFRGPRLEKLKKIINLGGGTRFNQINESVSHVVMGEKVDKDCKMLEAATFKWEFALR